MEAQRVEAEAVAAAYRTSGALLRARTRYEKAVEAASESVKQAEAAVAEAQARLIEVSGAPRAARLLGISTQELPRRARSRTQKKSDD
jgi:hypothetical protein